jgi:hypothetical protein
MIIQVPDEPRRPFYCGDNLSPHDKVVMKRDREEWDNEGGAARLPTRVGMQAPSEAFWRDLADILPPPIMANRKRGTLRCAYND